MPVRLGELLKAVRQSDLLVTPRLNQWLLSHDVLPVDEKAAQRIYAELIKQQRVREGTFGGSSAGKCQRLQVLDYLGVTPKAEDIVDPRLRMIFANGTFVHLRWQTILIASGIAYDIEVRLRWKARRSDGSMDAIGSVPNDHPKEKWRDQDFGIELKSENSFKFVKTKQAGPDQYRPQVARYCISGGFKLFSIITEDKNTQDWFEWVIEPTQEELDIARDELDYLNKSVDTKKLPPMLPECKMQRGEKFRFCKHGGRTGPCVHAGQWPSLK